VLLGGLVDLTIAFSEVKVLDSSATELSTRIFSIEKVLLFVSDTAQLSRIDNFCHKNEVILSDFATLSWQEDLPQPCGDRGFTT